MHYSLFIPKVTNPDPAHLARVGLGQLIQLDQPGPMFSEVLNNGPDGGHGLYIYWPNSAQHYRPGELKWKPARGAGELAAGRFYWGVNEAEPVTAEDLIRPTTLKGEVCFGGGNVWLVPNVLLLPSDFILNDSGKWTRDVCDSHRKIYDRCMWCFGVMSAFVEQRESLPVDDILDYVVEILSLNYTVFRDLVAEMRLFSDNTWVQFASRTVDSDALIRLQDELKKKRLAASEAVATPLTSPPGDGPKV